MLGKAPYALGELLAHFISRTSTLDSGYLVEESLQVEDDLTRLSPKCLN